MNDSYLADDDFSGVQSVADIQKLLSEAQTPGPSKYHFGAAGADAGGDGFDDVIDQEIDGELLGGRPSAA